MGHNFRLMNECTLLQVLQDRRRRNGRYSGLALWIEIRCSNALVLELRNPSGLFFCFSSSFVSFVSFFDSLSLSLTLYIFFFRFSFHWIAETLIYLSLLCISCLSRLSFSSLSLVSPSPLSLSPLFFSSRFTSSLVRRTILNSLSTQVIHFRYSSAVLQCLSPFTPVSPQLQNHPLILWSFSSP